MRWSFSQKWYWKCVDHSVDVFSFHMRKWWVICKNITLKITYLFIFFFLLFTTFLFSTPSMRLHIIPLQYWQMYRQMWLLPWIFRIRLPNMEMNHHSLWSVFLARASLCDFINSLSYANMVCTRRLWCHTAPNLDSQEKLVCVGLMSNCLPKATWVV